MNFGLQKTLDLLKNKMKLTTEWYYIFSGYQITLLLLLILKVPVLYILLYVALGSVLFFSQHVLSLLIIEKTLIKHPNLIEKIQHLTKIGYWELDLHTKTCKWSKTTYEIHEVPIDTPIKLEKGISFYIPAHREIIENAVHKAITTGEGWDLNLQIVTATGNKIWVRAIGEVFTDDTGKKHLRGTFQNINNQIIKSENIKELNEQLEMAFKVAKIGFWIWDLETNKLTWNSLMFDIYEIDQSNHVNLTINSWKDSLHPEDKKATIQSLEESLHKNEPYKVNFRIVTPKGNIKYIKAVGKIDTGTNKKPIRVLGINIDITKEELQKANLIKLNKELTEFNSVVAHDLKQPVIVFNGYLDLFNLTSENLTKDQNEYLKFLKTSAEEMNLILEDLLDLIYVSKTQENITLVSDLNQILNKVLEHQNLEQAKIDFNMPKELPTLAVDVKDARSLFKNLISNAVKFSKPGIVNNISLKVKIYNKRAFFTIRDSGIGILPKDLNEVIKPFYRGHTDYKTTGTGMGLTICKRIVEKYNGALNIKSEHGQSTEIHFDLPTL